MVKSVHLSQCFIPTMKGWLMLRWVMEVTYLLGNALKGATSMFLLFPIGHGGLCCFPLRSISL